MDCSGAFGGAAGIGGVLFTAPHIGATSGHTMGSPLKHHVGAVATDSRWQAGLDVDMDNPRDVHGIEAHEPLTPSKACLYRTTSSTRVCTVSE